MTINISVMKLADPNFQKALVFRNHLRNALRPLVDPVWLRDNDVLDVELLAKRLAGASSAMSVYLAPTFVIEVRDNRNNRACLALDVAELHYTLCDHGLHVAERIARQLYEFVADSYREDPYTIDCTVTLPRGGKPVK